METSQQRAGTTIAQALDKAAAALRAAGVSEARRDAGLLIMHALAYDRAFLIAHGDDVIDTDAHTKLRRAVARRARGEPLQYITGRQEFYGLDFEVTPDVLIPRPETELLVEAALELLRDTRAPRLCDVGTGTGCISITLLYERRDARAVALDISPAALAVAARNAARHGVAARLQLTVSDCFAALAPATERFDLILSNPPYVGLNEQEKVQREVREHEPRIAIFAGQQGLDIYRRLIPQAHALLRPGGWLLLEIGYSIEEEVRALLARPRWSETRTVPDLQGIPRVLMGRK